jgi:hypothetical protein
MTPINVRNGFCALAWRWLDAGIASLRKTVFYLEFGGILEKKNKHIVYGRRDKACLV